MWRYIALLLIPLQVWAWEPTKPVTVIVGFAPGSGNEIAFRQDLAMLAEIIRENR